MILNRLILKNFRQFEGDDNRLDFSVKGDKHVTLIFASNGVGKTTILSAIVWCLYGGKEIEYGDQKDIFLNKNTFANLPENGEKEVEVILTFNNRKDLYTVKRSVIVKKVDNQQQNIRFNPVQVEINNIPQNNGQERIDNVLSNAMHGYFFFKGEGVGKYADSTKAKLVQQGIKNIMKIDTREQALKLIDAVRKQFNKEASDLQTNLGEHDAPEARRKEVEEQKEKLEQQKSALEKKIEAFDELLKENQESLSKVHSTKALTQQAQAYKDNIEKLTKELQLLEMEQKTLITKSAYLALSHEVFNTTSIMIANKQKAGELPIIGIGKEYIENLLRNHECICGTKFNDGDEHHQALLKVRDSATAKGNIEASVSALGNFVEAYKGSRHTFEKDFQRNFEKITETEDSLDKLYHQLNAIEKKIEQGLPEEDNLMTKRKELQQGRDDAKENHTRCDIELEQLTKVLQEIQRQIDTASVQNQDLARLRHRVAFCEQAIEMLTYENAIEIETIRQELTARLKRRFEEILHSNKTAELDEEFKLRILENDQVTAKSDGEDKLISLIFISTLIDMARERENNKDAKAIDPGAGIYPIVIDSPYGEFDSVYKKNISEAVKTLAPQVIILLNQEHWNEGQTLGPIFEDSLAHQYALIAHRPKLDILDSEKNVLRIGHGPLIDLEVQDDREFTTIQRIEVTQ